MLDASASDTRSDGMALIYWTAPIDSTSSTCGIISCHVWAELARLPEPAPRDSCVSKCVASERGDRLVADRWPRRSSAGRCRRCRERGRLDRGVSVVRLSNAGWSTSATTGCFTASVTTPFTAGEMVSSVLDGSVSVDDLIRRRIPELGAAGDAVHLVTCSRTPAACPAATPSTNTRA